MSAENSPYNVRIFSNKPIYLLSSFIGLRLITYALIIEIVRRSVIRPQIVRITDRVGFLSGDVYKRQPYGSPKQKLPAIISRRQFFYIDNPLPLK